MEYKEFVSNQVKLLKQARQALACNDFQAFSDKMTEYNDLCGSYVSERQGSSSSQTGDKR